MTALRSGRPLWLGRHAGGRGRSQTYPSLQGQHDTEIAIVGGGIIGATIAVTFASAGVRVAIVEAERVGRGSTAASTALLLGELDLGLAELGRRYGAANARRIWQLSARAARDFVRTVRRFHIPCELAAQDSVYFTTSADTIQRLRSEHGRRCKAGFT